MKSAILALLTILLACSALAATCEFSITSLDYNLATGVFAYPDCDPVAVGSDMLVPGQHGYVRLFPGESGEDVTFETDQTSLLGNIDGNRSLADAPTGLQPEYAGLPSLHREKATLGRLPGQVIRRFKHQGENWVELLIGPVTVEPDFQALFHDRIDIAVGNRLVLPEEFQYLSPAANENTRPGDWSTLAAGDDLTEYIVVTNETMSPAFERFVDYKSATGLATRVILIDSITAQYSGVDDAERLREYLKDFYAAGGLYVLLAGDETILPVRYAYHFATDESLDITALQVCDLYFADLTGKWEVDGDGIWGEPGSDSADLDPELRIGRLPFNALSEAEAWVDKLIAYETNPGNGDFDYLGRTYFFSSDQMRDYSGGGQHARVAAMFPEGFGIDTASGVEQASGDDANPTNPCGADLLDTLSRGYGIINILAHGTASKFEVRTSGYNNFPKCWIGTGDYGGTHGQIQNSAATDKPGLYYSIACDNGAFDKDQPPVNHSEPSLVQTSLAQPEGGAVAFVANTRWGWVGSSHLLEKVFYDSLFANPGRPAIEAFYEAKDRYYYYRDLVYGQSFFGDPSMVVHVEIPQTLAIDVEPLPNTLRIRATSQGSAIAGVMIYLSDDQGLLDEGLTDGSGEVEFELEFSPGAEYTVAAVKPGHTVATEQYSPGIAADADIIDGSTLPQRWSLAQNYPNPFNPRTSICFDLPRASDVELTVINIVGQTVANLSRGRLSSGTHVVEWDGSDADGDDVASGIYFYRLAGANYSATRKMVLLR